MVFFISVRSDFSLLNFYFPEFLFGERSVNVRYSLVFFSKVVLCVCGMVLVAASGSGVLY